MRSVILRLLVCIAATVSLVLASYSQETVRPEARGAGKNTVGEAIVGGSVTITAPTVSHQINTSFEVQLRISDVAPYNIDAYEGFVLFDQNVIQFNGCDTAGTTSTPNFLMICNTNSPVPPGKIRVVFSSFTPMANGPGGPPSILLKLNFTAIGAAGQTSPIGFESFFVKEGDPATIVVPGQVTLTTGTTAADVFVSGRVLDGSGRGLSKERLVMTDSDGEHRYALTNAFGYYRFTSVAAGETYVINVQSKRYTFSPKTISPSDDLFELDFIAGQ